MEKTKHLNRQFKASVSSAAMIAAAVAFAPSDAGAQNCTVSNNLQGLADGTIVACPSSNQLQFPGGIDQGPFTIPDGSTLNFLANGNNPVHQGWGYDDPNGTNAFVFLSGDYNLRNGIGGATVFEGAALNILPGAGACATGGQVCPGSALNGEIGSNNLTNSLGGGVGGAPIYPISVVPPETSGGSVALWLFEPANCVGGSDCSESAFRYGFQETQPQVSSLVPGGGALTSSPVITVTGRGFDDDFFNEGGTTLSSGSSLTLDNTIISGNTASPGSFGQTLTIDSFRPLTEGFENSDATLAPGFYGVDVAGGPGSDGLPSDGSFLVDAEVRENLNVCQATFGSCSLLVGEGGGTTVFHYPPVVSGISPATSAFTSGEEMTISGLGFNADDAGSPTVSFQSEDQTPEGATTLTSGYDEQRFGVTIVGQNMDGSGSGFGAAGGDITIDRIRAIMPLEEGGALLIGGPSVEGMPSVNVADLLQQHEVASTLLNQEGEKISQGNVTSSGAGGAASGFSYPSLDGSSLFTGSADGGWAISRATDSGYQVTTTVMDSGGGFAESTYLATAILNRIDEAGSNPETPVVNGFTNVLISEQHLGQSDGTSPGTSAGDEKEEDLVVHIWGTRAPYMPESVPVGTASALMQIILALEADPLTAASRVEDVETAGIPKLEFDGGFEIVTDGFESGDISSWSRPEDP